MINSKTAPHALDFVSSLPRRVLVAEDDGFYRRLLQRLLKGACFEAQVVRDGLEALQAARKPDAPRLLLLDWVMPGLYGPEVCRQLRANPGSERYQYVLLLTAKDAKTDTVAGLEAGADDYLTKPFDSQELLARLRAGVRVLELQDRLLEAQKELEYQATHDPLTGLWNRLAWRPLLNSELERARRTRSSLTALMIDIDHFKSVNDGYGHSAGDTVLRELAQTLQLLVRAYDVAGRYGGEEFILIAQQLSRQDACEYAERIRDTLAKLLIHTEGASISVTVSIGVAHCETAEELTADLLVRAADDALYQAKAQGRNRVVVADEARPAVPAKCAVTGQPCVLA
jgi:diguanylate cyclase (GGDEF)-like protein